jgi:hypothetical protein
MRGLVASHSGSENFCKYESLTVDIQLKERNFGETETLD